MRLCSQREAFWFGPPSLTAVTPQRHGFQRKAHCLEINGELHNSLSLGFSEAREEYLHAWERIKWIPTHFNQHSLVCAFDCLYWRKSGWQGFILHKVPRAPEEPEVDQLSFLELTAYYWLSPAIFQTIDPSLRGIRQTSRRYGPFKDRIIFSNIQKLSPDILPFLGTVPGKRFPGNMKTASRPPSLSIGSTKTRFWTCTKSPLSPHWPALSVHLLCERRTLLYDRYYQWSCA